MERFNNIPKVIRQGFLADGRHFTLTDIGLFTEPYVKSQPIIINAEFGKFDYFTKKGNRRNRQSKYE